jgi:hypothetical protein
MVRSKRKSKSKRKAKEKIKIIDYQITRDNMIAWACHLCFDDRINIDEVVYISFLDGSYLAVCNDCLIKCLELQIDTKCLKPKIGIIVSEIYAKMVREMNCN